MAAQRALGSLAVCQASERDVRCSNLRADTAPGASVRRGTTVLCALAAGCGQQTSAPHALPSRPDTGQVEQMAAQTLASLGPSFQPIYVCGPSEGRGFQPSRSAAEWIETTSPAAIVLAIDERGALEILKQSNDSLGPVTAAGGLVVPVKFDPAAGDIAVAVAYTRTGVSESYAFSTFNGGPSFLTWTINIPQSGERPGGRGVQAFIAQCVELSITPVGSGPP